MWPLFLLLLVSVLASDYVDVTSQERYGCLLRTEDYILPSGQPSNDQSLFYGIFYIAVDEHASTLQVTGVHQVGFATLVTLNGPAAKDTYSPNIIYTLASGAGATEVPVQATFAVTAQVLDI